jgi:hypothetical protein
VIQKIILFPILILLYANAAAQMPDLSGKTIGIYFSGKQFSFSDDNYMRMHQFLQADDDRSWGENMKAEFLVRLGERLRLELQVKTAADSVYFINSDRERGAIFLKAYNPASNSLSIQSPLFAQTDLILVMNELEFSARYIKSMIIRSNRMIPERTRVHQATLATSWFAVGKNASLFQTRLCFDEKVKPPTSPIIDIYDGESALGTFLTQLYSYWWVQNKNGIASDCK